MKTDNPIVEKSKAFAVATVRACQRLRSEKGEYVLSKQLIRCGTSIGANVHEAIRAQSRPDFLAKMAIALKESQETEYWLDLLHETDYLATPDFAALQAMNAELLRLLTAICKTTSSRPR
ncbi:MAG: four helix bundle protein [Kiritimatiellae bacterium]|nr:four helix bundle protein [Kiritimatiellia bacterium]